MWKKLKCPARGKWINKLKHMHKLEYYTAIERNELLIHAKTKWLSKIHVKQKLPNTQVYSIWHKIISFI